MVSRICRPTVNTGFSAVIGSWKIMETFEPRIARMARSPARRRSRPAKVTAPLAARPGGSSPMTA